jgi:hypothetical protein
VATHHLFVPGMGSAHLDGDWLRALDRHPIRRCARLVHAFGFSTAAVETTLRTGYPPRVHGVLFPGDLPRVPDLLGEIHQRNDSLLSESSRSVQVRLLNAILDDLLQRPGDLVLVSSGPELRSSHRVAELPRSAIDGSGLRVRTHDHFALCESVSSGAAMTPELRDELLRTRGVARVLDPTEESAGAWMAPADRGWILMAEPDWSFDHPRPGGSPGGPLLLAFGPEWKRRWPDSVHDWRVAPTLLRALGRPAAASFDEPLDGAESLRG